MFQFAMLLVFLLPAVVSAQEYCPLTPLSIGDKSTESYFDSLALPDIKLDRSCPEKGECSAVVVTNGQQLRAYNPKDRVSAIARARFNGSAKILVSRTHRSSTDTITTHTLFTTDGGSSEFNVPDKSLFAALASHLTKDGHLLVINRSGLSEYSGDGELLLHRAAPSKIEYAAIANNPDGDIGVVAIDENNEILIGTRDGWGNSGAQLSTYGDRKGVLAVYPGVDAIYATVYSNMNVYNKGLKLLVTSKKLEAFKEGFLFNSEERNVGFDPDIYATGSSLVVSATNSSAGKRVFFDVPLTAVDTLQNETPPHCIGHENPKNFDFLVGAGTSLLYWVASSRADSNVAKYDISKSFYKQISLEGRMFNTHLGVSYLQNEAEQAGGLTRKASRFFSLFGDFNKLINPQNSLRLTIDQGTVNGIVTVDKNPGGVYQGTFNLDGSSGFTTRITSVNVLVMQERGYFYGLEYTKYTMPSILGFSDSSKAIRFVALDKDLGIKLYALKFGYDSVSYAKRYENNFSSLYFDGSFKLGLGWLSISEEVKSAARNSGSYRTINAPLLITTGGGLEIGYLHQMRIKKFDGLGMSIKGGYQVKGQWMGAGQGSKSSIGATELAPEFSRYDIFHGPFVQANVIF